MGWLIGIAIVLVFLYSVYRSMKADERRLQAAATGSTRIESVKAQYLNRTVAKYARFGWAVVEQSSAKSFGSQARVTITFRKGEPQQVGAPR